VITLKEQVAFLRAGIVSGVLSPIAAVDWADRLIQETGEPPAGVYDVSLAPSANVSRVLDALGEVASDTCINENVAKGLLDVLRGQCDSGAIHPAKAVRVAYALTHDLGYDSPICIDALILEENYSMASDGIFGTVEEMNAQVREWLASFKGAADVFIAG
jgi:hypothetical protein